LKKFEKIWSNDMEYFDVYGNIANINEIDASNEKQSLSKFTSWF